MLKSRVVAAVAACACLIASGSAHAQATLDNFGRIFQPGPWGMYFSGGATVMRRSDPANGIIVSNNPSTNVSFLNGSQFSFGWETGFDGTVGIRFLNTEAIEFRFMNLNSSTKNQMTTPGNFIGAGFTGPGGTLFQSDYDTSLRNFEVNWRHQFFDQLTFLVGVRQMTVQDTLDVQLNTTVARGKYDYRNHLTGGQIGLDWALFNRTSPFQLNLAGKLGWYHLEADGGISEFQGAAQTFIGSFESHTGDTVWAGELGASAGYRLTQNIMLRAGYQVLYFDKVALASDNAAFSRLNPSLLRGDAIRDTLVFQGFNFGVTVSW
jgi:hypothetical protein